MNTVGRVPDVGEVGVGAGDQLGRQIDLELALVGHGCLLIVARVYARGRLAARGHPSGRPSGHALSPTSRAKPLSRTTPSGVCGRSSSSPGEEIEVRRVHRARDRDVQPVAQQQELEPARRIAPGRRRERHDRDGRLLALEPVDRADRHVGESGIGQRLLDRDLLRVVRGDDDDVASARAGAARAASSAPSSPIRMPVHSRPTRSRDDV